LKERKWSSALLQGGYKVREGRKGKGIPRTKKGIELEKGKVVVHWRARTEERVHRERTERKKGKSPAGKARRRREERLAGGKQGKKVKSPAGGMNRGINFSLLQYNCL
jgi:hypothetical protein